MKHIKIITIILIIATLLVIGFGIYSFVEFQKKLYNTITLHNSKITTLFTFLSQNFPEQVKQYDAEVTRKLKESLPTNNEVEK